MPVPKKKMSATRSGNRRSHLALAATAGVSCSNCGAILAGHTVCKSCGYYKGKLVVPAKAKNK